MSEMVEMKVTGMTCSGCASRVSRFLEDKGMQDIYVNFATDEVRFRNENHIKNEIVEKGIKAMGYGVQFPQHITESSFFLRFSSPAFRFWVTLPFTAVLMLHMIPGFHFLHHAWIQLFLCIPVAAIGFYYFGRSAWQGIREKMPNMDLLIFIGSFSAFIYSVSGMVWYGGRMEYIYFETTASIITLVLLGVLIEKKAARQTASVLSELEKLRKLKAIKILKDLISGQETEIETMADMLRPGDIVKVNTGSGIPSDGIIIKGGGNLDESMVTGESLPLEKWVGDRVTGGTVLTYGNIQYRVTATGNSSTLGKLIELVKQAQSGKPAIQRLSDKIAAVFVPVVIVISVVTFFINYSFLDYNLATALMRAIAVLVISCPCAMGLATPLAVMVGIGKAAQRGILFKSGAVMENLALANYYLFDKTGTLTTGNLRVSNFKTYDFSERDAKNFIHFMERNSNHPIAQSILENHADWYHHSIAFNQINEIAGMGIKAADAFNNIYMVGNQSILTKEPAEEADVYFTINQKLVASFNMSDEIQESMAETVSYLKENSIKTAIISGDSERKCKEVAQQAGMDEFYAKMTPELKLEKVKKFSERYHIAMVGDGINDAPSMVFASVSVSPGNATDVAKSNAGVLLNGATLPKLKESVIIARATYKTIRQNLLWALAYNLIAIPLAGAGFLSPTLSALGMAFSDVVVVGNSLRLKRLNFKKN